MPASSTPTTIAEPTRHGLRRAGRYLLLLALLSAALAFCWAAYAIGSYVFGTTAKGEVVGLEESTGRGSRSLARSVIQFTTADGRRHQFTDWLSRGGDARHTTGEAVTVLYDPDAPQDARLASSLWWHVFGSLFLFGGSLTALLLGGVLYLLGRLPVQATREY